MRRVLFSLLAAGLVGIVSGCCHTHGVCDCDIDDHCSSRQPWVSGGTTAAPLGRPVSAGKAPVAPAPEKTRSLPAELPPGME